MGAILTKFGKDYLLRKITGKEPQGDLVLHLYSNDYFPTENSILSDLNEVIGGGYSSHIMWGVLWDEKTTHFENTETFEFTEKIGKIYGYYGSGRGQLIFAERFADAPYELKVRGDKIEIKIRMELK